MSIVVVVVGGGGSFLCLFWLLRELQFCRPAAKRQFDGPQQVLTLAKERSGSDKRAERLNPMLARAPELIVRAAEAAREQVHQLSPGRANFHPPRGLSSSSSSSSLLTLIPTQKPCLEWRGVARAQLGQYV